MDSGLSRDETLKSSIRMPKPVSRQRRTCPPGLGYSSGKRVASQARSSALGYPGCAPRHCQQSAGVFAFHIEWLPRGYFDQSISEGVQPYKTEGGHKPWMEAQCAAAEKHLTGMVRRAYFLCRFTGQRISDVIRLGETFIEDGGFRLSQKKTGRQIGEMAPD